MHDRPAVRAYLECFGEAVRLVASDQDVPEWLWEQMRDAWSAMTPAEREFVEQRATGSNKVSKRKEVPT